MNPKRILFLLLLAIISYELTFCSIYNQVHNRYTYKYDGKMTGIDSLINVDGYYHNINTNINFLFYRDGTFAHFFGFNGNRKAVSSLKSDSIDIIPGWGQYKIHGDTIKTQSILVFGYVHWNWAYSSTVDVEESWFKIINKDSLLEIYCKCPDSETSETKNYEQESLNTKAYFTPFPTRPDSSCWLKTREWAWEEGKFKK